MKILIAEDDVANAKFLSKYLSKFGDVVITPDGIAAVDEFVNALERGEMFGLVCLDIMMPKIDGYTATRVIRSTNRQDAKVIPIIAMTAHVFDEDVKQCLEAGMNAHLPKPLQMEKVVSTIARLCKRKK